MSQMKWTDGCDALVDFVEEHGGSMGGETRDHLFNIVQNIIDGQVVGCVPPTATDLISREAAIEALETWIANQPDGHYFGAWADAIREAQKILETLPSSAPPVAPVPPKKVGAVTGCTNPLHNHYADVMHNISEWAKCTYVSAPPVAPSEPSIYSHDENHIPNNELPGMWDRSDYEGGEHDLDDAPAPSVGELE